MARTLSEHDIALLLKLAPECDTLICKGSENTYRSILPPVANHYAKDADDFAVRLNRLTDEGLVTNPRRYDPRRKRGHQLYTGGMCRSLDRKGTSPRGAGGGKRTLCSL